MAVGSVSGLSSGINWADTIDRLMAIERRPVGQLQARRQTQQSKLTLWNAVQTKLSTLQSRAQALDSVTEFLKKSGTSSDSDVLTVTATASAVPGRHEVVVNQLAQAAVHAHQTGWADTDTTPVNSSGSDKSFSYDYAGTTVTVTVPDGTTLQGLVNLINRDPNNPGVTASIVNDGTGGGSDYHLVLTGRDPGAGNDITIIDTVSNPTDLGPTGVEFDEAGWDTTQAAQNAQIKVDGIPAAGWGFSWIESDSNQVADVIPGVTLNLKAVSASPVTVDIALDATSTEAGVDLLVSAFNDLMDTLNNATRYDPETETAGLLAADSLARSLKAQLLQLFASDIPGTDASDTYRSLRQVGLKITSGGKLTLDKSTFEEALADDPVGVARLFAFDATSSSTYVSVTGHGNDTQGGTHAFTLTYTAAGELDPSGTNTLAGVAGVIRGTNTLEGADSSAADGLLIYLTNPGDGPNTLSGTVRVWTGLSVLVDNFISDQIDPYEGGLKAVRDQIDDSIDQLDRQIASWERRLQAIEDNYTRRFTEMEVLISQMRTQNNYLASFLS